MPQKPVYTVGELLQGVLEIYAFNQNKKVTGDNPNHFLHFGRTNAP
jgi:hypothetical protein